MPRIRRISEIKPLVTNLAQTSHYEVKFGGLPGELTNYLIRRGVDPFFINEQAGLLCHSAVLPTTQFATSVIKGNHMGINEIIAHTRLYDQISLDFYVDSDYKTLKFMELWMEFISSGSHNPIDGVAPPISINTDSYFIRMQYPEYYKCDQTRIIKFDRDYNREVEYTFRGLFPMNIVSIPVSYTASDILKISAVFQFDRYIMGSTFSISENRREENNKVPNQEPPKQQQSPPFIYRTGQALGNESGVRRVRYNTGNVNPEVIR